MKQVFQTDDNKVFQTAIEALEHEDVIKKKTRATVRRILGLQSIRETLLLHGLPKVAFWEVYGESSDGYNPGKKIGNYHGSLDMLIEEIAKKSDQFFSYGHGGHIKQLEMKEL